VSAALNFGLLCYALKRKLTGLELQTLRRALMPMLLATVLAGGVAWWGWRSWEERLVHATLVFEKSVRSSPRPRRRPFFTGS